MQKIYRKEFNFISCFLEIQYSFVGSSQIFVLVIILFRWEFVTLYFVTNIDMATSVNYAIRIKRMNHLFQFHQPCPRASNHVTSRCDTNSLRIHKTIMYKSLWKSLKTQHTLPNSFWSMCVDDFFLLQNIYFGFVYTFLKYTHRHAPVISDCYSSWINANCHGFFIQMNVANTLAMFGVNMQRSRVFYTRIMTILHRQNQSMFSCSEESYKTRMMWFGFLQCESRKVVAICTK